MFVLGKAAYEPIGAQNKALSRMYTACTEPCIQDIVLDSFQSTNSSLCILIAIAFEMGLDCPDIRRIIHWSSPDNIMYMQEIGK